MSLFDFFSSSEVTPDSIGRDVLLSYYNEAKNFPEFTAVNFNSWISWLNSKVPNFPGVIGDLVQMNSASITKADAQKSVARLANTSGGKASIPQIIKAAGGSGNTVNYYAAIPEVAKASSAELLSVAQDIGAGVLGTLRLTRYLPFILLGAGTLAIYFYTTAAGSAAGKVRSKL